MHHCGSRLVCLPCCIRMNQVDLWCIFDRSVMKFTESVDLTHFDGLRPVQRQIHSVCQDLLDVQVGCGHGGCLNVCIVGFIVGSPTFAWLL